MAGETLSTEAKAFRDDLLRIDPPALIGSQCSICSCRSFPPRDFCPNCKSEDASEIVYLAIDGVIFSFTIIHQAPAGRPTPYVLAYVDLNDGVRVMAQIACQTNEARIGLPVRLILTQFNGADENTLVYAFAPLAQNTEIA